MSTSIKYHGFGAVNYRYLKAGFHDGCLFFHVRKRERRCCACGSHRVIGKGVRRRRIQTVPIGLKRVFFEVENRRLLCRDCGALRYESLGIADARRHYDRALERYIAALCRLMTVKDVARPLSIAYILKEQLRRFWTCADQQQGRAHLLHWINMARNSGIRMLHRFARSLERHRHGLLAYFLHPISTGRVEGINNKIKVLKRKAYGYRDLEYFELKIYAANTLRYSLLG